VKSWREDASQQAQDDLDALLSAGLGFAQGQLEQHGAFFPFAVGIVADTGEPQLIAAVPERGGEQPDSLKVIDECVRALTEGRSALRAGAIVSDVLANDSDAIRVELEHADGIAIAALLPYAKRRLGKKLRYADVVAQDGVRRIWA
jgi:hypothetical protein